MSPAVLELKDVAVGYGSGAPILGRSRSMSVRGEAVALVGRNGTGKSTLLRTMRGFLAAG